MISALMELTLTGTASLLSICYAATDTEYSLSFSPPSGQPDISRSFSNEEVLEQFSRYKLPSDSSFVPRKMEIREQSVGRNNEDWRRLFLLGKDKVHYKIFKFGTANPSKEDRDHDVSMS